MSTAAHRGGVAGPRPRRPPAQPRLDAATPSSLPALAGLGALLRLPAAVRGVLLVHQVRPVSARRSGSGWTTSGSCSRTTTVLAGRPRTRCGWSWCMVPARILGALLTALLLNQVKRGARRLPHAVLPAGAGAAGRRHDRLRLLLKPGTGPVNTAAGDARHRRPACGSTPPTGPSRRWCCWPCGASAT